MNKKYIILFTSFLLGLIFISSCNKENVLNDLQGKTFVPKEKMEEGSPNMELFFRTEKALEFKIKDISSPDKLSDEGKSVLSMFEGTDLLELVFELNYSYEKTTKSIKITKPNTYFDKTSKKIDTLLPLFIESQMKDKSDTEKALAKITVKAMIEKRVKEGFDELYNSIESVIYNEEMDELIIRFKEGDNKENETLILMNAE